MKVLLITHNPICTNNNMGKTFLSLFSEFEKEQLCQLYIHPAIPDVDVCHSYFQITDKQVAKALPFGKPGTELSVSQIYEQIEKRKKGEVLPPALWKGINPWKCLLRDIVWGVSSWYSEKLKAWLDWESPTCIFLAPGYAKFIYNIALKIANERNIPIVTYICDDYYFVKKPHSLIGKMHLTALQKKTDYLMHKTDCLVVISEEIRDVYSRHFGVKTEVIMTGSDFANDVVCDETTKEIENISYFGNLGLGRYVSLAAIGRILDEINYTNNLKINLCIYTNENDEERLAVFESIHCVKLCGFVTGQAFDEAFMSSDMLIHTESFEDENIDLVKHSVSTKIADALASGIPLLAYGPEQISSMQHLIRNNCALTATSPRELKMVLEDVVLKRCDTTIILKNAKETLEEYHDKKYNSIKIKAILTEVGED